MDDSKTSTDETVLMEGEECRGWEYILAEVQESLPGIDSDSETSTLSEDGHSAVFNRKVATFDNTDSDSDISSLSNFPKCLSEKQDSTLNSEGYVSASSASPTSYTSSVTPQPSSDESKLNAGEVSPSNPNYTSILFQRLQSHLKENVHVLTNQHDDLHLCDMDLELPIYGIDKSLVFGGMTTKVKDKDQSPPPLDMLQEMANHTSNLERDEILPVSVETDEDHVLMPSDAAENGKAPVLSLRGLEGFDLDELLDDLCIDDSIALGDELSPRDTNEGDVKKTGIMSQLIGLSKTQRGSVPDSKSSTESEGISGPIGDKLEDHKKLTLFEKSVTEKVTEEKDPSSIPKVKTSSCGVSTCFTSETKLSVSEPTTIFLDLRPKIEQDAGDEKPKEDKDDNQMDSVHITHQTKQTCSSGVSTDGNQEISERVRSLTRIRMMTRENSDDSDSGSDDEDYREWQALRRRIKDRSSLTAAASPKSRSARKHDLARADHVDDAKMNLDFSRRSVKPVDEASTERSFGEDLANIEHIDKDIEDSCPYSSSGDVDDISAMKTNGIYARQRLKKEESPKDGFPIKSSLKNDSPRTNDSKTGKIMVTFAEEPKKDDSDHTNVYRAKGLSTTNEQTPVLRMSAPRPFTSACVQTEDSFPTKSSNVTLHKALDEMLRRRESKYPDKEIDKEAAIAKKLEQARAIVSSTPYQDHKVEREIRLKLKMLLEREESKLGNGAQLLYNLDASYEVEIANIPPTLQADKAQMVLLTINMSSTGTIVTHRTSGGHKASTVDPSIGFSITYPMLLSWLLALVPEDLNKLHQARMDDTFALDIDPELVPELTNGKDGPIPISVDVPFNVVALHQTWQEDTQSLALQAVVIPNFFYKPESKRGRKKAKKEDAFLQVVWHFLQSNRIQDVCPWHEKPESPIHYALSEIIVTCATKPLSTYVSASNDSTAIKKALKNKPGIFTKMMTPDDQVASPPSDLHRGKLQMTMCLLQKEAFMFPIAVLDVAIRLQTSCFDLSGLRLCYVTRNFVNNNTLYHNSTLSVDPGEVVPCVVMAIRGHSVISRWSKIVGPRDPVLARMSERMSLNANYGEQLSIKRGDESLPTDVNMFCYPRSEARALQQLCVWFGGRVDPDNKPFKNLLEPNTVTPSKTEKSSSNGKSNGKNGKSKSRSNSTTSVNHHKEEPATIEGLLRVPSYIITCCETRLFLVVSPRLPTQFLSDVLYTVTHQGFLLHGVRRFRLNERKAAALSISSRYFPCFCPRLDADATVDAEYYEDMWWMRPATVILLSRENAVAHQAGLMHALQTDLMVNLSPPEEEGHMKVITYQCFHTTPYTESTENAIGSLTKVPDIELSTGSSPRSFYSNPEMEQVVVLCLLAEAAIDGAGEVLRNLLHGEFPLAEEERNLDRYSTQLSDGDSDMDNFKGFELLGMKWLPSLNGMQANELTPFEVGTSAWHESLPILQSVPAMLFVLRRVNAFEVLEDAMRIPRWGTVLDRDKFTHFMSRTPEIAYRQMKTFFSDKELFPDNQSRPLLKYLPPPTRVHQYRQQSGKLPFTDGDGGDQMCISNGNTRSSENSKKSSARKKKKQAKKDGNNNNNGSQNGNGLLSTSLMIPDESIFSSMVTCQQPLTSVLIIKPDAFPRHFIKIFRQLHYEGFRVVALNAIKMSEYEAMQIVPPFLKDMHGESQVYIDHMTSGLSLVACLQRDNAVRRLHELAGHHDPRVARGKQQQRYSSATMTRATLRARFGIDNMSNGIHVSDSYISSCDEMKLFFPEGLCCPETLELKMELVPTPAEDTYMKLEKMMGREVEILPDERQSSHTSALRVTYIPRKPVVVILTPPLFETNNSNKSRPSRHPLARKPVGLAHDTIPPYVEVLDQLLSQGFEICAMRMVWFRQEQAERILKILDLPQSDESMVGTMTQGTSLLLVLQRENALVLFDSILGSTKSNGDSLYHKFSKHILRSQREEQTKQAAKYLFPRIPFPGSVITISHKRAMEWKEMNCGSDTKADR